MQSKGWPADTLSRHPAREVTKTVHPIRKKRLILVLFVVSVAAAGAWLLRYALGQNASFFYAPSAVASGEAPRGTRIRVGGMVVVDSVERSRDSLRASFKVSDGSHQVQIVYSGILPDMFAENEAAIAVGHLREDGVLEAEQVLAKHDENYTPPEVADAMEEAHRRKQQNQSPNDLDKDSSNGLNRNSDSSDKTESRAGTQQ